MLKVRTCDAWMGDGSWRFSARTKMHQQVERRRASPVQTTLYKILRTSPWMLSSSFYYASVIFTHSSREPRCALRPIFQQGTRFILHPFLRSEIYLLRGVLKIAHLSRFRMHVMPSFDVLYNNDELYLWFKIISIYLLIFMIHLYFLRNERH